jgi:hypothetical protein
MRRTGGLVVLALMAGCAHNRALAPAAANDVTAQIGAGLAKLRAATDKFHNLDSAAAAGYAPTSNQCYIEPGGGAMGYHHVNRALADRTLDPEHPEILLYERTADGHYNLTAVEFIVPYRVWPPDSAPPMVMGLPLGHVDVLNVWGLHMWVWKNNPSGTFAWWNPDVTCLENQTRMPEHQGAH